MSWQPMATAPDMDRVIVAGWQKATRTCQGYWWMHEDVIVDGNPCDHPTALLWHPFPERPDLPAPLSMQEGASPWMRTQFSKTPIAAG